MSLDGGPNFPSAAFDSVCIVAASVPGPPGAGAERVCWLLRRGAHIPLSLRPHAVHGAAKLGDLTSFAALLEMQREQGPDKGDGGTQQWGRGRLYDNNVAERLLVLSALGFTPGLKLVVEQMGLAAAAAVPSPTDGGGRRGGGGDGEDGGVELVTRCGARCYVAGHRVLHVLWSCVFQQGRPFRVTLCQWNACVSPRTNSYVLLASCVYVLHKPKCRCDMTVCVLCRDMQASAVGVGA